MPMNILFVAPQTFSFYFWYNLRKTLISSFENQAKIIKSFHCFLTVWCGSLLLRCNWKICNFKLEGLMGLVIALSILFWCSLHILCSCRKPIRQWMCPKVQITWDLNLPFHSLSDVWKLINSYQSIILKRAICQKFLLKVYYSSCVGVDNCLCVEPLSSGRSKIHNSCIVYPIWLKY